MADNSKRISDLKTEVTKLKVEADNLRRRVNTLEEETAETKALRSLKQEVQSIKERIEYFDNQLDAVGSDAEDVVSWVQEEEEKRDRVQQYRKEFWLQATIVIFQVVIAALLAYFNIEV